MERLRKLMVFGLAFMIVPTLTLLGNSRAIDHRAADFLIFTENGRVGLKDESGKVLIPAQYEALGWSDSELSVVDKVIGYREGNLWGILHTSNRIVVPAEYVSLNPGEGSFLIAAKTSISLRPAFGVITTSGKKAIPPLYDGLQLANMRAIVMVRSNNEYRYGLCDLDNRLIIPLEYRRIYPLGSLRYAVENTEGKTAIFSENGIRLTAFDIDSLSPLRNNHAIVFRNQRLGIIDRQGNVVVDTRYGGVRIEDGAVWVREAHTHHILSATNQLISKQSADSLVPLSSHHYAVQNGGKYYLVNNAFDELHPTPFSSLTEFTDSKAFFSRDGVAGVITDEGRITIPAQFAHISREQGVYRARYAWGQGNQWTLLNEEGKPLTERLYQFIGPWNGKFFPARDRDHWGGLSADGHQLFSCVHDSLLQIADNHIVVGFKKAFGIIDFEGNWVVTPGPHPLKLIDDELYFEYDGATTFLRAIPGRLIYFSDNPLSYHSGAIVEQLPAGGLWMITREGVIAGRSEQPEGTEEIMSASEGYRAVRRDGKYGFIDEQGRLRIANRYEAVAAFNEGLAAIRIQGRWGFIDRQERIAVQPIYEEVQPFNNGIAIVTRDGLSGAVDKSGKIILPLRYDAVSQTSANRLLLRQGNHYGLATVDGQIIAHPRYSRIKETPQGYFIVERDGKWGLLTHDGVSTVPLIYDNLVYDRFRDQFIATQRSAWKKVDGIY